MKFWATIKPNTVSEIAQWMVNPPCAGHYEKLFAICTSVGTAGEDPQLFYFGTDINALQFLQIPDGDQETDQSPIKGNAVFGKIYMQLATPGVATNCTFIHFGNKKVKVKEGQHVNLFISGPEGNPPNDMVYFVGGEFVPHKGAIYRLNATKTPGVNDDFDELMRPQVRIKNAQLRIKGIGTGSGFLHVKVGSSKPETQSTYTTLQTNLIGDVFEEDDRNTGQYHAGKEFVFPLDNTTRIDEVINLGTMNLGDYIAHDIKDGSTPDFTIQFELVGIVADYHYAKHDSFFYGGDMVGVQTPHHAGGNQS